MLPQLTMAGDGESADALTSEEGRLASYLADKPGRHFVQSSGQRGPLGFSAELEAFLVTPRGMPDPRNDEFMSAVPGRNGTELLPRKLQELQALMQRGELPERPLTLYIPQDTSHCVTYEMGPHTVEGGTAVLTRSADVRNMLPVSNQPDVLLHFEDMCWRSLRLMEEAAFAIGSRLYYASGTLPSAFEDELDVTSEKANPRFRQLADVIKCLHGGRWSAKLPLNEGEAWEQVSQESIVGLGRYSSCQFHWICTPETAAETYNDLARTDGIIQAFCANDGPVEWIWRAHGARYWGWLASIGGPHRPEIEEGSLVIHGRKFWNEQDSEASLLEWFAANRKYRPSFLSLPTEQSGGYDFPAIRRLNGQVWTIFSRPCLFSSRNQLQVSMENRCKPMMNPRNAVAAYWYQVTLIRGLREKYRDLSDMVTWDQAKENLFEANLRGNQAQLWFFGKRIHAGELKETILDELVELGHRLLNFSDETFDVYAPEMAKTTTATGSTHLKRYMGQIDAEMPHLSPREKSALLVQMLVGEKPGNGLQAKPWSEWPEKLTLTQDDLVKF